MPSKKYPTDITDETQAVLEAWREIDPALQIGGLALATLEAELSQARAVYAQIDALDARFTDLRNQRDVLGQELWDKLKRVRAGVKGLFGDDSSQYEMMGGTRLSDRKRPTRQEEPAQLPE
jgi:hypothetical protein